MSHPHYDLHCHSTASDGVLAPADLVARAHERGVELLALTDHDTVSGLRAARQAAESLQMQFISGCELTCQWRGRVVHVLGLGIDEQNPQLAAYLRGLDDLREQRAVRIAAKLQARRLPDLMPAVRELAAGGQLGRPHFAQAMVDAGIVPDAEAAFKHYLGAGKPASVSVEWPEMADTLAVIRQAGGQAVLAHPTKYRFTFTKIRELLADFAEAGGAGVEAAYPGIKPDHQRELAKIAARHQLALSAGSDFHRPGSVWMELGKYPGLQGEYQHILERLG